MAPLEHLTRIVTTTWDDGHKDGLWMAGLLRKYTLTGSLYVARRSVEFVAEDRLTDGDIPELALGFEVGGHTLNQARLGGLSNEKGHEQITAGKRLPEDVVEGPLKSFCYPGAVYSLEQRVLNHISRGDDVVYRHNAVLGSIKHRMDVMQP